MWKCTEGWGSRAGRWVARHLYGPCWTLDLRSQAHGQSVSYPLSWPGLACTAALVTLYGVSESSELSLILTVSWAGTELHSYLSSGTWLRGTIYMCLKLQGVDPSLGPPPHALWPSLNWSRDVYEPGKGPAQEGICSTALSAFLSFPELHETPWKGPDTGQWLLVSLSASGTQEQSFRVLHVPVLGLDFWRKTCGTNNSTVAL
jgi:hypothetical protein